MASFCTDEHVPSVFITTLRSNGYTVVPANDIFGEGTEDRRLLEYCKEEGHQLITHDKKDFGGRIGAQLEHPGIFIYTGPIRLRDEPERVVRTIESVLEYAASTELEGERVWIDQWYDIV